MHKTKRMQFPGIVWSPVKLWSPGRRDLILIWLAYQPRWPLQLAWCHFFPLLTPTTTLLTYIINIIKISVQLNSETKWNINAYQFAALIHWHRILNNYSHVWWLRRVLHNPKENRKGINVNMNKLGQPKKDFGIWAYNRSWWQDRSSLIRPVCSRAWNSRIRHLR